MLGQASSVTEARYLGNSIKGAHGRGHLSVLQMLGERIGVNSESCQSHARVMPALVCSLPWKKKQQFLKKCDILRETTTEMTEMLQPSNE